MGTRERLNELRQQKQASIDSTNIQKRNRLGELRQKKYAGQPGYMVEDVIGVGETLGSMASGFAAAVPATGYGLYEAAKTGDINEFAPVFKTTQEAATYEPVTNKGKEFVNAVGDFYKEYVSDTGDVIGDYLMENFDSPALAAAGKTAPEAVALILPFAIGRGIKGKGKPAEEVVDIYGETKGMGYEKPVEGDFIPGEKYTTDSRGMAGEELKGNIYEQPVEARAGIEQKPTTGTEPFIYEGELVTPEQIAIKAQLEKQGQTVEGQVINPELNPPIKQIGSQQNNLPAPQQKLPAPELAPEPAVKPSAEIPVEQPKNLKLKKEFIESSAKQRYEEIDANIVAKKIDAPTLKDLGLTDLKELRSQLNEKQLNDIGYVDIPIPGGGNYKVLRIAERLDALRREVKTRKIFTKSQKSGGTKQPASSGILKANPTQTVKDFMAEGQYDNAAELGNLISKPLRHGYAQQKPIPYALTEPVKLVGSDAFVGMGKEGEWRVVDERTGMAMGSPMATKAKAIADAKSKASKLKPGELSKKVDDLYNNYAKEFEKQYGPLNGDNIASALDKIAEVKRYAENPFPFTGRGKNQSGGINPELLKPIADKVEAFRETLKLAANGSTSIYNAVGATLFFKSVQRVRDFNTPAAKSLADLIYADEFSTRVVSPDLIQRTMGARGEYQFRMNEILNPIRGRLGQVPKKVSEQIYEGLRTGKVPKYLEATTREIRALLDDFQAYMRDAGVESGYIKNYVPQVWDTMLIQRHPIKFKKWLEDTFKISGDKAEGIFKNISDSNGHPELTGSSNRYTGKMDFPQWANQRFHSIKNPNAERARKLNLPENASTEWLVTDIDSLLTRYFRKGAERSEFVRTFGDSEQLLNQHVAEIINEKGIAQAENIANVAYALADALQSNYRPIQTPALATANSAMAAYETITHLGWVSLASIPETLTPALMWKISPKAYAKGMLYSVREATAAADRLITGKRHIPTDIAEQHLQTLGNIIKSNSESMSAGRFTNFQRGVTNKFMKVTLLEHLTNMQRVVTYYTMQDMLKSHAKVLSKGKAGKKQRVISRDLIELGIKPKELTDWYKNGMPKESDFQPKIDSAIQRGVTWTITHPNSATKPLWMSDPHMQQLSLFKSFITVFSNTALKKVLINLKRENTTGNRVRMLSTLTGMAAVAYYLLYVKEKATGNKNPNKGVKRALDAVDRAGLTGSATHLYSILSPYRYNQGYDTGQSIVGLAGPLANDFFKMLDPVLEKDKRKIAKRLAKQTPVLNMTKATRKKAEKFYKKILP